MSHICLLEWNHISPRQYYRIQSELGLARLQSLGRVAYDAEMKGGTLMVLMTWDAPAAFDLYCRTRLTQAAAKAGVPLPRIQSWPTEGPGGPGVDPLPKHPPAGRMWI
jgi:hypothetical protein